MKHIIPLEFQDNSALAILWRSKSAALYDQDLMREFLISVIDKIGMRQLNDPEIIDVALQIKTQGGEPYHDEGGITGMVSLSTSHIAMHTWPAHDGTKLLPDEDGSVIMDIVSCRPFAQGYVQNMIWDFYKPSWMRISDVSRVFQHTAGLGDKYWEASHRIRNL